MAITQYAGGKGNSFRPIINLIPPHDSYIEMFAGGAAVWRNIRRAKRSLLIDLDPTVADRWSADVDTVISDGIDALAVSADVSGFIDRYNDGDIVTMGSTFIRTNGIHLLPQLVLGGRTFVYADPPYLAETRTSQKSIYNCEMLTVAEHEAFLSVAAGLDCRVMISGYQSELYHDMLSGWSFETYIAYDRANQPRTECLWFNYERPSILHDHSWLGDDFRERERIGRKVARHVKRLKGLPPLERQAILYGMYESGLLDDLLDVRFAPMLIALAIAFPSDSASHAPMLLPSV